MRYGNGGRKRGGVQVGLGHRKAERLSTRARERERERKRERETERERERERRRERERERERERDLHAEQLGVKSIKCRSLFVLSFWRSVVREHIL